MQGVLERGGHAGCPRDGARTNVLATCTMHRTLQWMSRPRRGARTWCAGPENCKHQSPRPTAASRRPVRARRREACRVACAEGEAPVCFLLFSFLLVDSTLGDLGEESFACRFACPTPHMHGAIIRPVRPTDRNQTSTSTGTGTLACGQMVT